jgi:hypothetical protein
MAQCGGGCAGGEDPRISLRSIRATLLIEPWKYLDAQSYLEGGKALHMAPRQDVTNVDVARGLPFGRGVTRGRVPWRRAKQFALGAALAHLISKN